MTARILLAALVFCGASWVLAADDADNVTLSPEQIRQHDIGIVTVAVATSAELVAPGTVEFDRDSLALVGPRLPAKVVAVVRDLGDRVSAGELIAMLDSVDLGKAKARHLALQAEYDTAQAASAREDLLAGQQISSEAERLDARARLQSASAELRANSDELRLYGMTPKQIAEMGRGSADRLTAYPLYSPIAGVLEVRDIQPGQSVAADATPIEVVNVDRMRIVVDASEQDVGRLSTGQTVRFVANSLPDRVFEGRIDWISTALEPSTRTLRLRVTVDNPDHRLKAGMYGSARIALEGATHAIRIPVAALQTLRGENIVFAEDGKPGKFRAVAVQTGRESQGEIEVTHGLSVGQRIVTSGAFALMSMLAAAAHGPDVD